jgi:hypothetical protein
MAAQVSEALDILLQYRRNGDHSEGRIVLIPSPEAEDQDLTARCVVEFEAEDFKQVLKRLAKTVAHYPGSKIILLRTDRPGLLPYVLDEGTTSLFRTDPVAAIHSMIFEMQEARLEKKPESGEPLEAPPVRAGYETLSDALGELVYLRMRRNSIECPGCGLWGDVSDNVSFTCAKRCWSKGLTVHMLIEPGRRWAGVAVEALLASPLSRFYLPRPWNDGRSWITREELQEKYTAYKVEKEQACSNRTTV